MLPLKNQNRKVFLTKAKSQIPSLKKLYCQNKEKSVVILQRNIPVQTPSLNAPCLS
jgi:hypothetical protein